MAHTPLDAHLWSLVSQIPAILWGGLIVTAVSVFIYDYWNPSEQPLRDLQHALFPSQVEKPRIKTRTDLAANVLAAITALVIGVFFEALFLGLVGYVFAPYLDSVMQFYRLSAGIIFVSVALTLAVYRIKYSEYAETFRLGAQGWKHGL